MNTTFGTTAHGFADKRLPGLSAFHTEDLELSLQAESTDSPETHFVAHFRFRKSSRYIPGPNPALHESEYEK
jgi:hypothetical protein